jgi:hypothetical protein
VTGRAVATGMRRPQTRSLLTGTGRGRGLELPGWRAGSRKGGAQWLPGHLVGGAEPETWEVPAMAP